MARLAGRRQSLATGRVYYVVYDPPGPDDPGPFIQRADDRPETIRRRLAIYHATAGPLARYYRERDLLADVDASGSIEAVADEILAALPRPVAAG